MSLETVQIPWIAPAHDGGVPGEESRPRTGGIVFSQAVEERFKPALAAVYDEMHARDDVIALLFFGSAQRGEAKPSSDLDLCALTHGNELWSRANTVEGVDVQLQLGPLRYVRMRIEKRTQGMTEWFATGELLFDKTGEATELQQIAKECYRLGPEALTEVNLGMRRFALTNLISDVEDMPAGSVEAPLLWSVLVVDSLKSWCAFQPLWPGKTPTMLRSLREHAPALAERVDRFYASPSRAHAIAVGDGVLETVGGRLYEFSTPPQRV
ncbi:MAG TPA: nucleotidyltransferase domain-containing protein [Longimicrobium sp.]|nr:nucleotidyltransferase domain-containing protein [Longimicrobium sp.]